MSCFRQFTIAWVRIVSCTAVILVASDVIQANPEGDALLAIKEALNANVNWSGNDPCEGWDGIICLNNHVIHLYLPGRNLQGKLPSEIGKLTFLQTLNLSNNHIEGSLPDEISNLTNLTALSFQFNQLYGDFPKAILKLKKLICLRLDNNHLSGSFPSNIDQLASLEHLFMGNCHFNGPIPSSIGNLTRLKAFSIWGNNINSSIPKELSQLVNLKLLNLHDANMYGSLPKEFGRMQYMKNLSLQSNFFTGTIPEAWMTMVNIEHLSAFNNHLSGDLPAWLSNISMKVNVGCNYFTGRKPTGFPAIDIVGNCFDGLDDHAIACKGSSSCVSFYSTTQNGDSSDQHTLVAIVSSVASILIVVGIFGAYCAWRKRNKAWQDTHGSLQDAPEDFEIGLWQVQSNVQKYSLTEILRITENFSQKNEIGFGGFGRVYKGYLDSECIVAVKRAFPSRAHGQMQFHNEVALLSRLHHKCLVRLMGYCNEAREQILVFEYLKNGNLNSLMWAEEKKQTLTWYKRIEIALAIAQGLDYLHSFVDPPIIHRDVKPSNILLDDYFCAKLADFGISRTTTDIGGTHISTTPAGTIGYVDPQYLLQHHLTTSSDVYSYGVVLLVLLTGQKAVDDLRVEESNLVEWVKIKYREADLQSIIDPCLQHHLSMHDPHQKRSRTAIELALKCTAFERSTRPSMKVVVETLDNILNEEDKKGELLSFQSLLSLSHRTSPNFTSEASSSGVQTSSHTC